MQNDNYGVVAKSQCPVCSHQLDCATPVDATGIPEPGDLSLCIQCGEILVFTSDLAVRIAEINDLLGLDPKIDSLLRRVQMRIRSERHNK